MPKARALFYLFAMSLHYCMIEDGYCFFGEGLFDEQRKWMNFDRAKNNGRHGVTRVAIICTLLHLAWNFGGIIHL